METASNPDWDVAKIKLQPQSIEAERSVLGALLISSDSWDGVAEVVAAGDFYRPQHRAIFRQIALLVDRGEPVDVITVADRLLATGELDAAGGHTYIAELAEQTPTASNVRALRKLYGSAQCSGSLLTRRKTLHQLVLTLRAEVPKSWLMRRSASSCRSPRAVRKRVVLKPWLRY